MWAPLGPAALGRFLDSYRRKDAGAAHRLVVLFNGFSAEDDLTRWRRLLIGIEHEEIALGRPLLDLAAYRHAVERVSAQRYCFVNSYSVVLVDDWLGKLERALDMPGAGLVGATGSWGSIRSYQRFMLGLGGSYGRVFQDRRATIETLELVAARHVSPEPKDRAAPLGFVRTLLAQTHGFTSFPAAHIRTNGFMVAADVLRRVKMPRLDRKIDVYRFESGRYSLTSQIRGMGLSTLVVGRDGRSFAPGEWSVSKTLWQGDQENLLISDNRTADYELGDSRARAVLSGYAWGEASELDPL